MGLFILAHELFHCLTRTNPDFHAAMYGIIHFTVQDEEFKFSRKIRERIISNPDVEQHNSYAPFIIHGETKPCTVVYYAAHDFEQPGDDFMVFGETGLVPIDDLSVLYDCSEADNFWDVLGTNTDYAIDPEEVLADNFAYAMVYGMEREYPNPEIIEAIQDYLKQ